MTFMNLPKGFASDNASGVVHPSGFKSDESRAAHEEGWMGGLKDLSGEIEDGRLRMVRVYQAPIAKLFETCKERMVKGKVLESVANQKLVFDLDSTRVSLTFDSEDDGGSSVELIHDHLNTVALQKTHRKNWETITEAMAKTLGHGSME
jgi:uncharacterized protein YndB with AHSA1/START domain